MDALITILKTFSKEKGWHKNSPNQNKSSSFFPVLSNAQIREIEFNLHTNNLELYELLNPISSHFIYNKNLFSLSDPEKEKAIYYNSIAWFCIEDIRDYKNNFEMLNEIMENILEKRKDINLKIFQFLMLNVFNKYLNSKLKLPCNLISILFEDKGYELFDLMLSILNYSININDNEIYTCIIGFIIYQFTEYPNFFIKNDLINLINIMSTNICSFEPTAIKLLSEVSAIKEDKYIIDIFFNNFPLLYLSNFHNNNDIEIKVTDSLISQNDFFQQSYEILYQIADNNSITYNLTPLKATEFDSSSKFSDYLSNEEISLLSQIILLFIKAKPVYVDIFIHGFQQIFQKVSNLYLYIVFQYFYIESSRFNNINEDAFQVLSSPKIFQSGISVFNKCKNFELIRFLRKNSIYIISKYQPKYLNKLLKKYQSHPFLIADIIGYISTKLLTFNPIEIVNESTLTLVVRTLSNLDSIYTHLNYEPNIQNASSTILMFLFTLFEKQSTAVICFSSSSFVSGFLSRIFEASLQPQIISLLKQFLTNNSGSAVEPTIHFIRGIFDVCRKGTFKDLPFNLLQCVNEAIVHNPKLPSMCYSLIPSITNYNIIFSSKPFFSQTLQFFSHLSSNYKGFNLSLKNIQYIHSTIKKIGVDEQTLSGLIGVMAGSNTMNSSSMFFIKVPIVILLFLSVIEGKEDSKKYLQMFNDLCNYSIYNSIQCHNGGYVDILLRAVQNFPNPFKFKGLDFNLELDENDITDIVIPNIIHISEYIASPQTISKIISIECFNNQRLNKFSFEMLKELCKHSIQYSRSPHHYALLGQKNQNILVNGLKYEHLEKGVSFSFYLRIDSNYSQFVNTAAEIFGIYNEKNDGIYFYIQGSSVVAKLLDGITVSHAPLAVDFPSGKWVPVLITIKKFQNEKPSISFSYDNKPSSLFPMDLFPFYGDLQIVIGGNIKENSSNDFYAEIGNFIIFKGVLSNSEINDIIDSGSTSNILYDYHNNNHQLIHIKKERFPVYSNIYHIFSLKATMKLLIPFFIYFDRFPIHYHEVFLDFLKTIIFYSETTQKNFHYFSLIANILINENQRKLTYSIYNKFFGFLDYCKNQRLLKTIIKNILFNFELWITCNATDLQKIVCNWESLYSAYQNYLPEFNVIASLVNIYFWYKPTNNDFIKGALGSERPRPCNLNIDLCRNHLEQILISAGLTKFTNENALYLISICLTSKDTKNIISFLSVFNEIIKSKNNITDGYSLCRLLYNIFVPKQDEIFLLTIEIIYNLDKYNFYLHLEAIMLILNKDYFTQTLYNSLLSMIKNYPLIYPICILFAIHFKDFQNMTQILNNLTILPEDCEIIVRDPFWSLWLLVLVSFTKRYEDIDIISNFVIKIINYRFEMSVIDTFISLIDLLASLFFPNVELFSKIFIFNLFKEHSEISLYHRCFRSIVLHLDKSLISPVLKKLGDNSPFSNEFQKISDSNYIDFNINYFSDLLSIIKTSQMSPRYKFSFLLNESGKLVDEQQISILLKNYDFQNNERIQLYRYILQFIKKHSLMESKSLQAANNFNDFVSNYYEIIGVGCYKRIVKLREVAISRFQESIDRFQNKEIIKKFNLNLISRNIVKELIDKMDQTYNRNRKKFKHLIQRQMNLSCPIVFKYQNPQIHKRATVCSSFIQPFYKTSIEIDKENRDPINKLKGFQYIFKCQKIRISHILNALFVIDDESLHIITFYSHKILNFNNISFIYRKNRFHLKNSIEIITKEGKSYLLDFTPIHIAKIISILEKKQKIQIQTESISDFISSIKITEKWQNNSISNFEYLMYLNILSGRTTNDSSLYPIFPWIFSDFEKNKFRDLTKPLNLQKQLTLESAPSNPSLISYYLSNIYPFSRIKKNEKIKISNKMKSIQTASEECSTDTNCYELTPEFFYSSYVFENIKLPKYEGKEITPDEFVYYHRKVLESDQISSTLHLWINKIFGVENSSNKNIKYSNFLYDTIWSDKTISSNVIMSKINESGLIPSPIFSEPHPPKKISRKSTIKKKYVFSLGKKISKISFLSFLDSFLNFLVVTSEGYVFQYKVDMENFPETTIDIRRSQKINNNFNIQFINNGFIFYDQNNISIETNKHSCDLEFKYGRIREIQLSESTIVILNEINNISIVDLNILKKVGNVLVFNDDVVTIGVSQRFKMVSCGTIEGHVEAFDFKSNLLYFTQLKETPKKIIITEIWGFTIVQTETYLYLININGKILREKQISFEILYSCSFRDNKSTDYIAIYDKKSHLYIAEAFTLEFKEIKLSLSSPIQHISYVNDGFFVIITKNGKIIILPYKI